MPLWSSYSAQRKMTDFSLAIYGFARLAGLFWVHVLVLHLMRFKRTIKRICTRLYSFVFCWITKTKQESDSDPALYFWQNLQVVDKISTCILRVTRGVNCDSSADKVCFNSLIALINGWNYSVSCFTVVLMQNSIAYDKYRLAMLG